jgi:hypothetical protein
LLFGTLLVASTSVFVSCKDYDDDISNLQTQIDQLAKDVKAIQTQIQNGAILQSVTKNANGLTVTLLQNGSTQTYDITNGTDGKPGTVWTIGANGNWFCDGVDSGMPARGEKGETGATGAAGKDGVNGKDGANGKDGKDGTNGTNGKDGANGLTPYIGANGNWWIGNEDTGVQADGNAGTKYYVPNSATGTFWVYNDGDKAPYDSNISFLTHPGSDSGAITATVSDTRLTFFGVEGGSGQFQTVTIELSAKLKSLVFKPTLYLDGIEAIEYPWLGDTILSKQAAYSINNLSHHRVQIV